MWMVVEKENMKKKSQSRTTAESKIIKLQNYKVIKGVSQSYF